MPDTILLSENDVGITSLEDLPEDGRLSSVTEFVLTIEGAKVDSVTSSNNEPIEQVQLIVQLDGTGNNDLDGLVEGFNAALIGVINDYNAGNDPQQIDLPTEPATALEVIRVGNRIRLQTRGLGRNTLLAISPTDQQDTVFTNELHFGLFQTEGIVQHGVPLLDIDYNGATEVAITSQADLAATLLLNGQLGPEPATFNLTVAATTVSVTIENTGDNDSLDDLVADINDALIAALGSEPEPKSDSPQQFGATPDVGRAVAIGVGQGKRIQLQTNGLGRNTVFVLRATNDVTRNELLFDVENTGQLGVALGRTPIRANWRDVDGTPLIEQFRISGLGGDDELGFVAGPGAVDLSGLSQRSTDWVGVIDSGSGDDLLLGSGARDRLYAWSFDPYGPLHFDDGQLAEANQTEAVLRAYAPMRHGGVLPRDARFALSLDGGDFVDVLLAADATRTNTSVADLVTELQNALEAAGLGAQVTADRDGRTLLLKTVAPSPQSPAPSLQIDTGQFGVFVEPWRAELHDPAGKLHDDTRRNVDLRDWMPKSQTIAELDRVTGLSLDTPDHVDRFRFELHVTAGGDDSVLLTLGGAAASERIEAELEFALYNGVGDLIPIAPTTEEAGVRLSLVGLTAGEYELRVARLPVPDEVVFQAVPYELLFEIGDPGETVVDLSYAREDTGLNRMLGMAGDDRHQRRRVVGDHGRLDRADVDRRRCGAAGRPIGGGSFAEPRDRARRGNHLAGRRASRRRHHRQSRRRGLGCRSPRSPV